MSSLLEQVLEAYDFPVIAKKIQLLAEQEEYKRAQFLQDITPNDKWEFILGEVVMHSPAKAKHLDLTLDLAILLRRHSKSDVGGKVYAEKCLISLTRNNFEPDVVWFSPEKAAEFTDDQMEFPAPDFIIEVLSPSTEIYDRGVKMADYAMHGVGEYWIVDPESKSIEQYKLEVGAEEYTLHQKKNDGELSPLCMPNLKIDLNAVFG